MRLAPYIAARAALSRRQAERAIVDGRVCTDFFADPDDTIALDGRVLDALPTPHLWAYFKPRGQLVTRDDPQGRLTVFDVMRQYIPEGPLVTVGRLDYASEGLLLVTNTPSLAHRLETSDLERTYLVQVQGRARDRDLDRIRRGCIYEGVMYRPCQITVRSQKGLCSTLEVTLTEGKNREIRRLMDSAGLHVQRLMRLSFGPFHLDKDQDFSTLRPLDPRCID